MITSIQNRATVGKVIALGFLLAALMAMVLSATPAGAAVSSGRAVAWGYNFNGQLGNGNTGTDSNVPVAVKNLTDLKSVKAGCSHSLALKTDGSVYAWGGNGAGQLGNGTFDPSNVPVKVKIDNVRAISAGCSHSLALKEDGSVWAWGYNNYGQLGNDTSGAGTDSNVPVRVASLGTGAKKIAAGYDFSLALMKDGTVNSWGYNGTGQLGNGTIYPPRDTPGPVSNLSGVKAIATDSLGGHALALLQDGTVRAWGNNSDGQAGDGTTGNLRLTPVAVSNLSGVKAIATGGHHSLALLESGKVRSWGWNFEGQLGNTNKTTRSTPGAVFGLSNVKSISGGAAHSLAVLESGEVRSWGWNYYGQLGIGITGESVTVPVAVKGLTNVTNVDGGHGFTLAIRQ